jgi:hypothetical protein
MNARLVAAPAEGRCGGGSRAPMSPKRRRQGSAVHRRCGGSPSAGSRVRVDKRPYPTIERRPSRTSVRIRPASPDQLPVPAQQRGRTHRQTPQCASRQRPAEGSEDRSVDGPKLRSSGLPAQDRQLMPEHEDLELLRALRSAQQHDQLNQATERHVDERPNHVRPPELGEGEGIDPPAKPTGRTANRVSEPHGFQNPGSDWKTRHSWA